MKKLISIIATFCLIQNAGLAQDVAKPVTLKKTDITVHENVKAIIEKAFPDRDLSVFYMRGFTMVGNSTEISNGSITSVSIIDEATCGTWTNKQKAFIDDHAKAGCTLLLEGITVMRKAEPGTPYTDENNIIYALPNVLVTITE